MMAITPQTLEDILSSEQIQRYRTEGYLVVPDLLTIPEIDAFLEYQRQPKAKEWQGLGLRRHTLDPQFRNLATHPKVVGGARQLLGDRPMIVQTMLLSKAPSGGRGIALHQDTHYLPSEPNTLMACWTALTDTDADNGGLCVVPGSHLTGLRQAQRNQHEHEQVSWEQEYDMRDRDGREYKKKMHSFEITDLDPASIVRLTVPRGSGVFFTGMTIHGSFANKSSNRPRIAFATHYVREGTWLFRRDVQETVPAM